MRRKAAPSKPKKSEPTFKLNEIEKMLGIPGSTILYWCRTFPEYLNPQRTKGGQRRYSMSDIEQIKKLSFLRNEKDIGIVSISRILRNKADDNIVCENAKDAVHIITKAIESIPDSPHVISMLNAVSRWISEVHPVLSDASQDAASV